MDKLHNLTRRRFLQASALAAGGTMLAACGGDATPTVTGTGPGDAVTTPGLVPPVATTAAQGGQPTAAATAGEAAAGPTAGEGVASEVTPIAATGDYKQAPMLDQMQGLAPVAERLPKNPYVVPHKWAQPGNYGGHLQMAVSDEWGVAHYWQESMYGHSILRYLNDGLDIGPGLAESWTSNDDASEWTFNFREGLKWSDGKPWTTADIMFWWEDMVLNEEHPAGPPDEARSGKDTLAKFRAVDDLTLQMTFDAPAPLTADRVAMWVNRGIGPDWHQPRHYMEQFHPKYNNRVGADWVETFDQKKDFAINPECPVTTGWKLKSYREGVNTVWERNPYYWCVDKEGNQLPYIDGCTMTNVQNPEVLKLRYTEGRVDYVHGGHTPLTLADVAGLRQAESRGLETFFWDSGSGTGSIFFLNYDFAQENMRDIIREPKFRQAISLAYNRDQVRKVVYFNQGEPTTGTLSPKAIEYKINDQGRQVYQEWRDSYVKHDPEQAKSLLDEIDVKDTNGDGMRELPGGGKLTILLEFQSTASQETVRKNELLARDLKEVGINAQLAPRPEDGWTDIWRTGKYMTHTNWEVGDGPNHLVYPQWLVPMEETRWAPLHGTMYGMRGTPAAKKELDKDPYKRTPPRVAPEEGGPIDRLYKVYNQSKVEPDAMKRHQLVWDMIKIHIEDGPFFMGSVANPPRIVIAHRELKNVPRREDLAQGGFVNPWIHPTPAVYDPEAYYWENPDAHTG